GCPSASPAPAESIRPARQGLPRRTGPPAAIRWEGKCRPRLRQAIPSGQSPRPRRATPTRIMADRVARRKNPFPIRGGSLLERQVAGPAPLRVWADDSLALGAPAELALSNLLDSRTQGHLRTLLIRNPALGMRSSVVFLC